MDGHVRGYPSARNPAHETPPTSRRHEALEPYCAERDKSAGGVDFSPACGNQSCGGALFILHASATPWRLTGLNPYNRAVVAQRQCPRPTSLILPTSVGNVAQNSPLLIMPAKFNEVLVLPSPTRGWPMNSMCPRPIPNSYWATPLLLACEYPWSPYETKQKIDALLSAGVRTFIDLTECGELSPYTPHLPKQAKAHGIDVSDIEYHSFPIRDRSLPDSVDYMCEILSVLRENEEEGRISAVHCRGGIGRTGMVIGCWLVECGVAKDGEDALRIIANEWKTVEKCKRFPHSPETGAQFDFVKNFQSPRMIMV
ncbi:phosphatases II [Leucogyrophana mollusca]|uniref:Phosphatases II n=1 Tax=Leucogyrophana mollusca TaxID=85980 RepID=A0ACB8B5H7_9AGAM|nr:phosphatases II [Leucogyrophana mollusca]